MEKDRELPTPHLRFHDRSAGPAVPDKSRVVQEPMGSDDPERAVRGRGSVRVSGVIHGQDAETGGRLDCYR